MSFRIHAAGTEGFRYTRSNCPDTDIFEAGAILSAAMSLEPNAGSAAQAAFDYANPAPSVGSVAQEGLSTIATQSMLQLLMTTVNLLAANTRANNGWIAVSARKSHALWPDTARFVRFDFASSTSPAYDFMRDIVPVLTATEMNNFGVLRQLAMALSRYHEHVGNFAPPMIQIQLSR